LKAKGKGGKSKKDNPKGSDSTKAGTGGDADSKGNDVGVTAVDDTVEDKLDGDEMGTGEGVEGGAVEQGSKEAVEGGEAGQFVSWEPRSDTMYIYVGLLAASLRDCATKKPADPSAPTQRSISDFVRPSGKSKFAAAESDFVAIKAVPKPSVPKAAAGASSNASKSNDAKGDGSKDLLVAFNQPALHSRVLLPPLKDGDVDVLAWGTVVLNGGACFIAGRRLHLVLFLSALSLYFAFRQCEQKRQISYWVFEHEPDMVSEALALRHCSGWYHFMFLLSLRHNIFLGRQWWHVLPRY
jgi:hypothetical protein